MFCTYCARIEGLYYHKNPSMIVDLLYFIHKENGKFILLTQAQHHQLRTGAISNLNVVLDDITGFSVRQYISTLPQITLIESRKPGRNGVAILLRYRTRAHGMYLNFISGSSFTTPISAFE